MNHRPNAPTYHRASWLAGSCLPLEGECVVSSRLVDLNPRLTPLQSEFEPFEFHPYAKRLGWKV